MKTSAQEEEVSACQPVTCAAQSASPALPANGGRAPFRVLSSGTTKPVSNAAISRLLARPRRDGCNSSSCGVSVSAGDVLHWQSHLRPKSSGSVISGVAKTSKSPRALTNNAVGINAEVSALASSQAVAASGLASSPPLGKSQANKDYVTAERGHAVPSMIHAHAPALINYTPVVRQARLPRAAVNDSELDH